MMGVTPEDLEKFLATACGTDERPLLLARDASSEIGWRSWTAEDTQALCDWLSEKLNHGGPRFACYNLKEAAEQLGVSVPKCQQWLRRRDHPIPHVRDGRLILIPDFLLLEWLREESARSEGSMG